MPVREDQSQQPIINIDFGPLSALLQQLLDAVNPANFIPAAIQALGSLFYAAMRSLLLTIWNGLLLAVPHDLTDQFKPVVAMMPPPGAIGVAGLVLALALLGLRTYIRGITGRGGILDEVLGRVMVYVSALAILPWIISNAIDLEQSLVKSVALAAIVNVIPNAAPADLTTSIALAIMFVLGVRLWLKLGANVVHVMVAIVWAPVALVCGLFPEASWVTGLWIREFTGRLAGAVLATIAVFLGFALALGNSGVLVVTGVAAAFLAAHDLVDWLARTPGGHMGGMLGLGLRLSSAAAGGGAGAVSAAGQASQMRAFNRSEAAKAEQAFYSYD